MPRTKQVEIPDDILSVAEEIAARASEDGQPDVHHMVRGLGTYTNPNEGVFDYQTVDAHVRYWLQSGYKLHTVIHGGTIRSASTTDQIEKLIYIFVKE